MICTTPEPIAIREKGAAYPGHFVPMRVDPVFLHVGRLSMPKYRHCYAKRLPTGAYMYSAKPKSKTGGWKPVTIVLEIAGGE